MSTTKLVSTNNYIVGKYEFTMPRASSSDREFVHKKIEEAVSDFRKKINEEPIIINFITTRANSINELKTMKKKHLDIYAKICKANTIFIAIYPPYKHPSPGGSLHLNPIVETREGIYNPPVLNSCILL